jgi:serine protease Do
MRWKQEVLLAMSLNLAIMSLSKPAPAEEIRWLAACDGAPFAIRVQSATSLIAQSFGTNEPRGALVTGLGPNNSASCRGLEVGDLIIKFDGREVNHSEDLIKVVGAGKIGKELPVVVL